MPYNYDAQINRLTKEPRLIPHEWGIGRGLFNFASDSNAATHTDCGCITMIRTGKYRAYTNGRPDEALTAEIAADVRIPKDAADITPEHLPVFKEWQERLDVLRAKHLKT